MRLQRSALNAQHSTQKQPRATGPSYHIEFRLFARANAERNFQMAEAKWAVCQKEAKANVHRPWPCASDTADRPLRSGRLPSTSERIAWERAGAQMGRRGPIPFKGSLAVLRRQAKPYGDWLASAPCQGPLGAATISAIYFGICSNRSR